MDTGNHFNDNFEEFVFHWHCPEKWKNSWNCILLSLFCTMLYKRRERMLTESFLIFTNCCWVFLLYMEFYPSHGMLAGIMDLLHFSHSFLACFTLLNIRFRAYFFFSLIDSLHYWTISWIWQLQNLENFSIENQHMHSKRLILRLLKETLNDWIVISLLHVNVTVADWLKVV